MKIRIPYILRHLTGDIETIETEGRTLGECLGALQDKFPDTRSRLFDEQGQLHKYVELFLNNRKISNRSDLPVKDEDELLILVVILGG
jgi:molybdopterin converting factor small subunit